MQSTNGAKKSDRLLASSATRSYENNLSFSHVADKMVSMSDARVVDIFTAPDKGVPMQRVNQAYARAGRGLLGDRYAEGLGDFSKNTRVIRHITLIGLEGIEIANAGLEVPYKPSETRRNIVTEGIDISGLVGRDFSIGNVVMRGVELCDPCARPEKLSGKSGFKDAFEHFGGLRAEIIYSGLIVVDDQVVLMEDQL